MSVMNFFIVEDVLFYGFLLILLIFLSLARVVLCVPRKSDG